MSRSAAVAAVAISLAGCNDAVILEVASDRPIPQAVGAICVGVADSSAKGGHFGKLYPLVDKLATLPQTLRIEPGSADGAIAWVRGDQAGVPMVRASVHVDFSRDVRLDLARCPRGSAAAPATRGDPVGPAGALLAASQGQGGAVVVAVGAAGTAVIDASGGALVSGTAPALPAGAPVALLAIDVDGDCDDDLVVATDGAPPQIWLREGESFVPGDSLGTAKMAALAAADVDHDGDLDLVMGGAATLQLWLNDGGGTFTRDASKLTAGTRATAISALATGDLDGDGNADLVVGQANAPLVAWLGEASGTGMFIAADAAVPAVPLDVESLTMMDADDDYDPDLAIAVRGAPMRLMIDRDGRLEDQTFVRLPSPPVAHQVAIGGWDNGCEPDAVIAAIPGAPTLRGQPGGAFAAEAPAPAATGVVMVDIDDDGVLDALLATPDGVQWLAR